MCGAFNTESSTAPEQRPSVTAWALVSVGTDVLLLRPWCNLTLLRILRSTELPSNCPSNQYLHLSVAARSANMHVYVRVVSCASLSLGREHTRCVYVGQLLELAMRFGFLWARDPTTSRYEILHLLTNLAHNHSRHVTLITAY
jgi:hypothetical protein